MLKGECAVKGVQFSFERRRYGRQTFTWLFYRDENDAWQAYNGDPWPSITIPKRELEAIAVELLKEYPSPADGGNTDFTPLDQQIDPPFICTHACPPERTWDNVLCPECDSSPCACDRGL